MKTLNRILVMISFAVLLITGNQINAQDSRIDFSNYVTGNYYKVLLANGLEVNGELIRIDDLTIDLKTESKNVRIHKNDVVKITKSYQIFKGNSLNSNLKTIVLIDGSEMIGHVRGEDSLKIKFETVSGTMIDINRDQIEFIKDERKDYISGDDPNKTRLFFAPTGKNLKGGTGYFSVHELLFPMLAFGITDFLTAAGGISILPGADAQLYYFNGKARVLHLKDLDVSAGILYTNITSSEERGLTVLYGNGTYGTDDASVTLGAGLTYNGNESSGKYPMLILGGEIKLSNSSKLITENWFPTEPSSYKILSLGVRFFGKSLAGDFGLIYLVDENGESAMGDGGWPFIPWIGLNYNFDL